jgi:ubiquinone/menaquinone biosynthesis C-methylase UbiE
MSTTPIDPRQWKARQRQEWDSVSSGWRSWWETFERAAQPLSDHLIALARIEPGQHVLDIATGIGEPAVTAARRVGPAGLVVAIDQSPQMLAIARERAAALGLQNVEFRELDAEQLDLLEGKFDAALCRWGLMHLPQLIPALEGVRQRLLPNGRFAAAVWSTPSKVPVLSLPRNVIIQYIAVPSPPAGTPGPFSLSDSGALEQAFAQAGFSEVQSEPLELTLELASASDYTRFIQAISPSINALLASQSAEQQERIWQAIRETVQERYGSADGTLRMPAESICIVAHH